MSEYTPTAPWPAVRRFEGESFSPSAPASLSAATWHPKPLDECSEEELGLWVAGREGVCDGPYPDKLPRVHSPRCKCHGTGIVPAFKGLRRDCDWCEGRGVNCKELPPNADDPHCNGRDWVPDITLETVLEAMTANYDIVLETQRQVNITQVHWFCGIETDTWMEGDTPLLATLRALAKALGAPGSVQESSG